MAFWMKNKKESTHCSKFQGIYCIKSVGHDIFVYSRNSLLLGIFPRIFYFFHEREDSPNLYPTQHNQEGLDNVLIRSLNNLSVIKFGNPGPKIIRRPVISKTRKGNWNKLPHSHCPLIPHSPIH